MYTVPSKTTFYYYILFGNRFHSNRTSSGPSILQQQHIMSKKYRTQNTIGKISAIAIKQHRVTTSKNRVFTNLTARIVGRRMWDKQGAPSAPAFVNIYGITDTGRGTPNLPNTSGNRTTLLAPLILSWMFYKYSKRAQ